MPVREHPMGIEDGETFKKFFECWVGEQNQFLEQLISASKDYRESGVGERAPRCLVWRVMEHYEEYYRSKSGWAKEDVLEMLKPPWRSSLESAFLWIGGWRPSMAFHLLYSKSGEHLEQHLDEVIRGMITGDLGDLSNVQVSRTDELQKQTLRKERDITEKMAKLQQAVADESMVELSHLASELERGGQEEEGELVVGTLASKEKQMEQVLQKADDLRLETLKGVVKILTPIQAVHFLIGAAELHLRLREWGMRKDAVENGDLHGSGSSQVGVL